MHADWLYLLMPPLCGKRRRCYKSSCNSSVAQKWQGLTMRGRYAAGWENPKVLAHAYGQRCLCERHARGGIWRKRCDRGHGAETEK